ncbi:MAG: hypothetical protein K6L73_04270 [Cellvibrionaceae bacterium]
MDVQQTMKVSEWPERAEQAKTALSGLKRLVWKAKSPGEATALVSDWVKKNAKKHGISILKINTGIATELESLNLHPVRVGIEGEYIPGHWHSFVSDIASVQPALVIESERIDMRNKNRFRYQLNLTAWVYIGRDFRND